MKKKKLDSQNIKINQMKLTMIFINNRFLSNIFGDVWYFIQEKILIVKILLINLRDNKFQKVQMAY